MLALLDPCCSVRVDPADEENSVVELGSDVLVEDGFVMCEPVPEWVKASYRIRDVASVAAGAWERVPELIDPELAVALADEFSPEPEAEPGNDLVSGLSAFVRYSSLDFSDPSG